MPEITDLYTAFLLGFASNGASLGEPWEAIILAPHTVPPDVRLKRPQVRQEQAEAAAVGELAAPDIQLKPPAADFRDAEITEAGLGELHPGPNPYGNFDRRLTDEGSFLFTFSAKDDRLWVRCLRLAAWLVASGSFGWWLIQPPLAVALIWKGALWLAFAYLGWKLLVEDRGHPCTIEVWSDSFVVDDKDIFWRAYLELGLPTLVTVGKMPMPWPEPTGPDTSSSAASMPSTRMTASRRCFSLKCSLRCSRCGATRCDGLSRPAMRPLVERSAIT